VVRAVIVATDAGSEASRREIAQLVAEGRALALGDKRRLGEVFSRESVALAAVVDNEVALGLFRYSAVLTMPMPEEEKSKNVGRRIDE
jgi:hypothetical protein